MMDEVSSLDQKIDNSNTSLNDQEIATEAIAFASSCGFLVKNNVTNSYMHAPISLFPTPFPAEEFQKAIELSPLFGLLVDKISRDVEWLHRMLEKYVSFN